MLHSVARRGRAPEGSPVERKFCRLGDKKYNDPMTYRFDITSQEFKSNPFPTLAQMREAGPVVRTKLPIMGSVWLVTTYEAVNELLRDHHRFVRDAKNTGKSKFADLQWWMSQIFRAPAQNMLAKDEPDHRRLRGLVDEAFRRRSVEDMRGRVHTLADELLDQAIAKSGAEGMIDYLEYARQLPLAVICELLGLPDEDRPTFTRWASGFSTVSSWLGILKLLPRLFRINGYFRRQIRLCRQRPRDGLISLLVEVQNAGDSLNEDELSAMAFLLLFAGHETTVHLIGDGLLTLLDHPQQKAELMSDWTQGESAVDELMRFNTPVQMTKPRIASKDMEFYGQDIKRGEYLMAMLAAANMDPRQFEDPERFDINRTPNFHVGFGTGIHTCLGLKLARMETVIAFERLLTRFPNVELATARDDVEWTPRIGMRALKYLPVQLNS